MSVRVNIDNRGRLNPLLTWLWDLLSFYASEEIIIPASFHSQVDELNKTLRSDISGIVSSVIDYAIDCALVDYSIETDNKNLTTKLNDWLLNINSELRGRIPTGIKALAKEYFRERWKSSSLLVARTLWDDVNGVNLPTKIWFLEGLNINVKNGDDGIRMIGSEQYFIKMSKTLWKPLPTYPNELIFVQKPYSSWSSLFPTPFLIQRGIYKNLKIMELLNRKGERIIGKALEYLLTLKKGTERLTLEGRAEHTYSEEDLKKVKDNFNTFLHNLKTEIGTPTYTTNFDTEFEHIIPDYSKAINSALYAPLEKRLLSGLGLVEIVEGTASSRKEAILNPKPFIGEVRQGIEDFKTLLNDIVQTIIDKNTSSHRKYFGADIKIYSSPIKYFITDSIRDHLRSMYDRGILSKQTYSEVCGEDTHFDIEIQRRTDEYRDGMEDILYPPVIQNQEKDPDVRTLDDDVPLDTIPEDKVALEKKNYQGKTLEQAPYDRLADLPEAVKKYPKGAQESFRKAFNHALTQYKDETIAYKIAWSILKKYLQKKGRK